MSTLKKWGSFVVEAFAKAIFTDAKTEVDMLRDEMESWQSNMDGTNLESTQKFEEVSEALENLEEAMQSLEQVEEDDVPDVKVSYNETRRRGYPRWVRLSNAMAQLEAVKDAIEKRKAELEDKASQLDDDILAEPGESPDLEKGAQLVEDAVVKDSELVDAIDEAIQSLESVRFPGMF